MPSQGHQKPFCILSVSSNMLVDTMQFLISPVIYSDPHIFEVHRDVFSHCCTVDVDCGVWLLLSYLLSFYRGDLGR